VLTDWPDKFRERPAEVLGRFADNVQELNRRQ
jgi:hypothetical protein